MRGRTGAAVNRLIAENAKYISSVPVEAAERLVHEVRTAQQSGARAETVAKMMRQRFPALLRSRVALIARTETAKASTALTQARCEELDLDWYVWESSEDVRVRDSHRNMAGVLVPWNDAPRPEALVGEKSGLGAYHAGSCPNCRCYSAPVLALDDVRFPARVYWQGAVRRMTKQEFKKIAVRLERAA
jgi:SPP1 gp7 family putative phage head morphogenesis protein